MKPLQGKRVLIVEDEAFIALDLKRLLSEQGARIAGPVPTLAAAGALLDEQDIDAAVLDVNLNGEMSYPLATKLRASNTPVIFITGYDEWSLPEQFRATPRVSKPFSGREVCQMIQTILAPNHP